MPAMIVWPDSWSVRDAERRVFLREALQRDAHLFLVGLGLRLDGDRDHGLRELHLLEHDDFVRDRDSVSPVVTSFRPTAAAMSPARTSLISVRSLACICSRRPMRSLRDAIRHEDLIAGIQRAGIDAEERQVADERVVQDLECQRGERLLVVRLRA